MRGKSKQAEMRDDDQFRFVEQGRQEKPRLNLNDLIQRMEDQKKSDKKLNAFIISGALAVAAVVLFIFSF
tara:strand:+ start:236 stop:445 length:210 start_codon:yes stop_codon:yes gene_type:complete